MKYKNIRITEQTHRRLKTFTASKGLEIGTVLNYIVLEYLEKEKA